MAIAPFLKMRDTAAMGADGHIVVEGITAIETVHSSHNIQTVLLRSTMICSTM